MLIYFILGIYTSASFSATFSMYIPIDQLDTGISVSMPLRYSFRSSSDKSDTGRSLSPRSMLYNHIEKYMGQATGVDGHACLLRAMCEASSTPLHDDGLLGDAVNFLLTVNYAVEESDDRFKNYLEAQAKGQVIK